MDTRQKSLSLWLPLLGPAVVEGLSILLANATNGSSLVFLLGAAPLMIIIGSVMIALRNSGKHPAWMVVLWVLGYIVAQIVVGFGMLFAACAALG
ncbi:MAG: hypothetical protein J0M04_22430 [Verrucomicrobia bacterium]|nr:hypothetical protein [Verrucomicrobiota bacterium]